RKVALAIEANDIPHRTDRIKHVILVIAHLQSTLDHDRGGKVAQDLEKFYNALRQNVMYVQLHPTKRAATQVITDLLAVREAWIKVELAQHPSPASGDQVFRTGEANSEFDSTRARVDWSG
ncbi:MAG: flagellar protein FliS, partial [Terriglobales bacterium]